MTPQNLAAINIFKRNTLLKHRGALESVSGLGSSKNITKIACKFIEDTIKNYKITSVSDCPCGDLNWLQRIDLTNIAYKGYDVVPDLIAENSLQYKGKEFFVFDAIKDILPYADLILCRDFLFHLHHNESLNVLENFRKSKSKYLLTTTFSITSNTDLPANRNWGFTKVNLQLAPFNLKEPLIKVKEFGDRYLVLFKNDT
jgi:hypothetical protein